MPQWNPRPGDSTALASGEPIITASATGDCLRDVSPGTHPAVGDDVDVAATRLVEVAHPSTGRVRDGGGHRNADAEHAPGGAGVAGADADEEARGTGTHQVQRRREGRTATDDDRHVEVADELLQVQRLAAAADVLGGDDGALDDEDVDAGVEDVLVQRLRPLRGEAGGGGDAGVFDLLDALTDQLRLDGLGVELLHPLRGGGVVQRGDFFEDGLGVLVPRPQPLEVEDAEAAELADLDGGAGRDDAVHGTAEQG